MIIVKSKYYDGKTMLEFYSDDYLIGAILDHSYDNNFDYSFLFNYLENIHWKFNIFSDFSLHTKEMYFEDEWDSYYSYEHKYYFNNIDKSFTIFYDDFGNNSSNINIEDVLQFISQCTGVKIKYEDHWQD